MGMTFKYTDVNGIEHQEAYGRAFIVGSGSQCRVRIEVWPSKDLAKRNNRPPAIGGHEIGEFEPDWNENVLAQAYTHAKTAKDRADNTLFRDPVDVIEDEEEGPEK